VKRALDLLAAVFANPAGGAPLLDELRARWHELAADERAALTPLAKLAAERVKAAPKDDPDGYWAALEADAPPEEEWSLAAAGVESRAPAAGGSLAPAAGDDPRSGDPAAPVPDWRAAHAPGPATAAGRAAGQDQLAFGAAPARTSAPPARATPPTDVTPGSLLSLLGLSAFRPGQQEAVQAALDGRDALVVMPTGGGKSLCYQLPALASQDLTVVVSPLIALMRDQCARLTDLGHPAVMLASGEDNQSALDQIRNGRATVVFAAPERFASTAFRNAIKQRKLALFVVDEAHCVSEWGHDFRPDYLRLASIIKELGHPPTMACTATATPKVAEEIVARLRLRDPARVRSGFDRPNLSFDVLAFDGEGSVARKRATLPAAQFSRTDLVRQEPKRLPFRDGSFDMVVLWQVLEHLFGQELKQAVVNECVRVLKPGGVVLVETPNQWFPVDYHDNKLPLVHWFLPLAAREWLTHRVRGMKYHPSEYVYLGSCERLLKNAPNVQAVRKETRVYFARSFGEAWRGLAGTQVAAKRLIFALAWPFHAVSRLWGGSADSILPSLRVVWRVEKSS